MIQHLREVAQTRTEFCGDDLTQDAAQVTRKFFLCGEQVEREDEGQERGDQP